MIIAVVCLVALITVSHVILMRGILALRERVKCLEHQVSDRSERLRARAEYMMDRKERR